MWSLLGRLLVRLQKEKKTNERTKRNDDDGSVTISVYFPFIFLKLPLRWVGGPIGFCMTHTNIDINGII